MKIIIVNGAPRSGKTTFCDSCFKNRGRVYTFSTIDEVKRLAKQLGWNGEKDDKSRKFLSDLKDALTEYNDLPHKWTIKKMQEILDVYNKVEVPTKDVIFLIQTREPEDIKRWVEDYNALTVFIKRPDIDIPHGNHADDDVSNYEYDLYIDNDGIEEELKDFTRFFIDSMRKNNNWYSSGPGLKIWDEDSYK